MPKPKTPKKPSLFARYEPRGMRHYEPAAEGMRDNGRLLDSARIFREAVAREGDSVYAAVAVGVWQLTAAQVRRIAARVAVELEKEVRARGVNVPTPTDDAADKPAAAVMTILNQWFTLMCDQSGGNPDLLAQIHTEYDQARLALSDLDPSV